MTLGSLKYYMVYENPAVKECLSQVWLSIVYNRYKVVYSHDSKQHSNFLLDLVLGQDMIQW